MTTRLERIKDGHCLDLPIGPDESRFVHDIAWLVERLEACRDALLPVLDLAEEASLTVEQDRGPSPAKRRRERDIIQVAAAALQALQDETPQ